MSISGINSSLYASYLSSLSKTSSTSSSTDTSAVQSSGKRKEGGDDFMQAVMQALSQAGISMTGQNGQMPPPPSDSDSSTDSTSATSSTSSTENPMQAMHKLMHDLFSALKSQNSSSSS